jgi:hypothetical protein
MNFRSNAIYHEDHEEFPVLFFFACFVFFVVQIGFSE